MTQVEKMMKALGISEKEARELINADKDIDKGKRMDFDLTPEQEKASKKARSAGKKPTVYSFDKRKRKENPEKRSVIAAIAAALENFHHFDEDNPASFVQNVKIENPERQIDFYILGNHYSLTLICHRPPKES